MYPLLLSGAVSLASQVAERLLTPRPAAPAAAPTPAVSFATELATTGEARLQALAQALSRAPAVQGALAAHGGGPVHLSFPAGGGVQVHPAGGPPVPVALDAVSLGLAREARTLLGQLHPGTATLAAR